MSKVDIKRLDSLSANDTTATKQINDNFQALQDAVENTLSRDGTTPNYMDADLDMNSRRIINAGSAVDDNDVVILKDVKDAIGNAAQYSKEAAESAAKAASSEQGASVSAANARISAAAAAASAQDAADTVAGFDAHAEEAKNVFDVNAATLTARYDNNDLAKTKAFNENAQTMTDGYNANALLKIDDFDAHAMMKEMEFDDNAAIKQAQVDAKALEAANSAREAEISRIAAKASEDECKRLVESLGVIFAYKGTVPTFNDLPMTDNRNGDVYRVIDQAVFYVWTDTEWQNLGGLIDISSLVTVNTDQEIDAHKTFLKDMGITSKDIDTIIDRNKRLQGLGYYDKNGLRGAVYPYVGASGNVELRLMASTGGASSFGAMGVTADGNPYMYAPKPPKESDDNSVATTDWVNEKDSEVARISNGLLTGNVSTNAEGYADVLKMNSSVAEHKYDVIESSIDTDDEGWHTGELTAVDIDVTKQYKLSIGFRVTGFPHEQGLFNFVSEAGDPNSCLVVDKDQKIKCRFTTTKQQHLEEINYIINPNYEYRVTWEYDKYVGYTINIYDGATLVKSQIINDTDPIDGISPRTLQFGIGYNSGTKLEGQLKGDFIQAYSEDKLVYAPHLAIHYRLSTYGTKIADVEYRDVVFAMYSLKNYAPYFTIDTANRNYTLPMGNIYKGWGSEHKVVSILPVNPDPNTYYYIPE